jgi:hypothetical protein
MLTGRAALAMPNRPPTGRRARRCAASEAPTSLPQDLEPVLEALFEYRNRVLHSGFEWPPENRAKFENRIKAWPAGWFECATSGDKPCHLLIMS